LHTALNDNEKEDFVERTYKQKNLKYNGIIKPEDISSSVEIQPPYPKLVQKLAKDISYDMLNSPIGCSDLIRATMMANATLNKRTTLCADDLNLIHKIRPYLINPFSPYDGRIVRLRSMGLSIDEISKEIGKGNYRRQIERVIEKAKLRGVLSPNSQSYPNGLTKNSQERDGETYG
jgi:hypothetical protein